MALTLAEQYDKIYHYCYFRIRDREAAEDLTQETFLHFYSQADYRDQGKPLAYLYTIARNACISYYRRKKEAPLPAVEAAETVPPPAIEDHLALKAAVEQLKPEQQELIWLRFGGEVKIQELAHILGISRFAVSRKLKAALAGLRERLREEDFLE